MLRSNVIKFKLLTIGNKQSIFDQRLLFITILKYIFPPELFQLSRPSLIYQGWNQRERERERERKIQNCIHEREKTLSISVGV